MTPLVNSSVNKISLFPLSTFSRRKDIQTKCFVSGKHSRLTSHSQGIFFTQSSLQLFKIYSSGYHSKLRSQVSIKAAVGTEVTVEGPNLSVSGEGEDETSEDPPSSVETSEPAPANPTVTSVTAKNKRPKPVRKSEMPPVKDEEVVPGATFTGKVRSIQPFGAFVDFGAYTDGLVHVSRMSDEYVKDVKDVVSIGQEVKVKIVEANKESGRISLTMRESDSNSKNQQKKEAPTSGSNERPKSIRKNVSRLSQKREEVVKKSSKFVKGQVLNGTVKNLARTGAFVSLPDGEEGFLPVAEESEGFGGILGNSALQVGQEVNVRVLRISRGQVTLTMKKEEDVEGLNMKLNQGVVHVATNPFELAFRKNKDIAAFLEEQEKAQKASLSMLKASQEIGLKIEETVADSDTPEADNPTADDDNPVVDPSASSIELEDEATAGKLHEQSPLADSISSYPLSKNEEPVSTSSQHADVIETVPDNDSSKAVTGSSSDLVKGAVSVQDDTKIKAEVDTLKDQNITSKGFISEGEESSVAEVLEGTEGISISESSVTAEVSVIDEDKKVDFTNGNVPEDDNGSNVSNAEETGSSVDFIRSEGTRERDSKNFRDEAHTVQDQNISSKELILEGDESSADSSSNSLVNDETYKTKEKVDAGSLTETAEGTEEILIPGSSVVAEVSVTDEVKKTDVRIATATGDDKNSESSNAEENVSSVDSVAGENSATIMDTDSNTESSVESDEGTFSVGVIPEKGAMDISDDSTGNDSMEADTVVPVENEMALPKSKGVKVEAPESSVRRTGNPDQGSPRKATISPALVKQLREETGAGMMDCKKALAETMGDITKAQEYLRKKGLASADKKASRVTAEGRIGSYIHDNRIGVLIEVNCETDFVSRGEIFRQLVDDLAMQVAACPRVHYLVTEDVPEEIVNKEKEMEMQKEDLLTKPEQIRSKIVEGRVRKRLEEIALLEQPYIKNDKMVVKDWVKQTIATIGENIRVRRFVRYNLGEGLEKKSQDFAAEVAAQTAAKLAPAVSKDQPSEAKETVEKPPSIVVSAALVKQLRDETGAGMMDCKKALTETGGDLEKAQEYLRKKGLSSADKKLSRLAAEGLISSYIHDSRVGALIEVNCETDFVGRNEKFKELVDDLAMQIVACPQVEYVSMEDVPESIVQKEKELEMQREDLKSKPENIREKIVEGRIAKRLGELALLEQPFIKDDGVRVKDLVKQTVAALGENVKVRRFVRYTLGESFEKSKD